MDEPKQRFKLTIAYRGTRYHGWQHQDVPPNWKGPRPPAGEGLPSVQEMLTRALRIVVNHPMSICGSSRTDKGVHAKGQVAHFDTLRTTIPPESLRRAVNHKLPDDILVTRVEPVPHEFDAILSTESKRYQYVVWNHDDRPPFFGDMAWHRWQKLDLEGMREAAVHFVGTHDFASFARPGHGRETTIRTVLACNVSVRGPRVVIGVEGKGFLWHMVRIMVGTLVDVGVGRYTPGDIAKMIGAKDRKSAGPTAPPHGLYLQWIKYRETVLA